MSTFFQAKAYWNYWLDAVDEHSLHSPFLYDFYTHVVKATAINPTFSKIEHIRSSLLQDQKEIDVQDFGSGTSEGKPLRRKVADIARKSLSEARFSTLYLRMLEYFKATRVLELGTSLGINTLYLAQKKDAQITTFEGAEEIADIAAFNFEFLDAKNIKLVTGNLQQTLPQWASMNNKVDFAFIDANHRYEPTLRYSELLIGKTHSQSILVIDDIHRSADMEGAWNELRSHPLVYLSVDLFRCGILFFDPSLTKQKVVLRF